MAASQPLSSPDVPESLKPTLERIRGHVASRRQEPAQPGPAVARPGKGKPPRPRFRGYHAPHFTMVPDEILDEQLAVLTGAELKCLLYIVRRTYGWKKDSDSISLAQMVGGIRSRSGEPLDGGVGLGKSTVAEALTSLEAGGYIVRQRRQSAERGHEATVYSLRMADS